MLHHTERMCVSKDAELFYVVDVL